MVLTATVRFIWRDGLQKATAQIDANASKIAQQTFGLQPETQPSGTTDVIPDALVQLKAAELQESISEVITRSDQMLGSHWIFHGLNIRISKPRLSNFRC